MQELKLSVTAQEGDKIIKALANLPYNVSFELIHKIQQQAADQLRSADELRLKGG